MLFFLLGKNTDEMLGFEQSWDCVTGTMHLGRQNSKFEEGWLLHNCGATTTMLDFVGVLWTLLKLICQAKPTNVLSRTRLAFLKGYFAFKSDFSTHSLPFIHSLVEKNVKYHILIIPSLSTLERTGI